MGAGRTDDHGVRLEPALRGSLLTILGLLVGLAYWSPAVVLQAPSSSRYGRKMAQYDLSQTDSK